MDEIEHNNRAEIGHNNPPENPIDEAIAPYSDYISESENWLDGQKVETEAQMKAVDVILKEIRSAASDLAKAEKLATAPFYDAWKGEIARWKPEKEDLDRIKKGLAELVNDFKKKLAAEKAEAVRQANLEAAKKRRKAEAAMHKTDPTDIRSQREAEVARLEWEASEKSAQAAKKDTVKGLRKVSRFEIEDYRAALHWIAKNDRCAMTDFIEEYVRRNHKTANIDGVRSWEEKEAY